MKKVMKRVAVAIILVISTVFFVLFLNSKFKFLSQQITFTVGNYYINIFNMKEIEPKDHSDYVLLSSLTNSSLFKNMDLLVPNNTFIPSEEEISRTYSGLYSDSVVASMTNTDIIIQNYGIEITEEMNLADFREQIVSSLKKSRPDIDFDTSRTIKKDNLEIPIIEFATEYENRMTYSFIALVDVKGEFVTVAVNSAEDLNDARKFLESLVSNILIK